MVLWDAEQEVYCERSTPADDDDAYRLLEAAGIQLLPSGDLTLDSEVYVDKILEAAEMTDCNIAKGQLSKDLL